jgi:hypothetical protein
MAAGALTRGAVVGGGVDPPPSVRSNSIRKRVCASTVFPSGVRAWPSTSTTSGDAFQAPIGINLKVMDGSLVETTRVKATEGELLAVGQPLALTQATSLAPPASAAMKARAWLSWLAAMRSCITPVFNEVMVTIDATASKTSPMARAAPRCVERGLKICFTIMIALLVDQFNSIQFNSKNYLNIKINKYHAQHTASWR